MLLVRRVFQWAWRSYSYPGKRQRQEAQTSSVPLLSVASWDASLAS